jgi:hypothetical protein
MIGVQVCTIGRSAAPRKERCDEQTPARRTKPLTNPETSTDDLRGPPSTLITYQRSQLPIAPPTGASGAISGSDRACCRWWITGSFFLLFLCLLNHSVSIKRKRKTASPWMSFSLFCQRPTSFTVRQCQQASAPLFLRYARMRTTIVLEVRPRLEKKQEIIRTTQILIQSCCAALAAIKPHHSC